jgi:hypothetical protein
MQCAIYGLCIRKQVLRKNKTAIRTGFCRMESRFRGCCLRTPGTTQQAHISLRVTSIHRLLFVPRPRLDTRGVRLFPPASALEETVSQSTCVNSSVQTLLNARKVDPAEAGSFTVCLLRVTRCFHCCSVYRRTPVRGDHKLVLSELNRE